MGIDLHLISSTVCSFGTVRLGERFNGDTRFQSLLTMSYQGLNACIGLYIYMYGTLYQQVSIDLASK